MRKIFLFIVFLLVVQFAYSQTSSDEERIKLMSSLLGQKESTKSQLLGNDLKVIESDPNMGTKYKLDVSSDVLIMLQNGTISGISFSISGDKDRANKCGDIVKKLYKMKSYDQYMGYRYYDSKNNVNIDVFTTVGQPIYNFMFTKNQN